jgi:hypothetical protein
MMAEPKSAKREAAILAKLSDIRTRGAPRPATHDPAGVIKLWAGMEIDPNENLALVVCFVGAVLADRDSFPHSLASRMAPLHTIPPGWSFIRRDFCLAAGDSVSARARSWVSR